MNGDLELLHQYACEHSESAFAALVQRHLNLVYSAALRQVRSPHLAEEVTQSVFTDLARQALRLAPDTILTAWLYQVTRRTAIDLIRRESSRQAREQSACELTAMQTPSSDWAQLAPVLDEAMEILDPADRAAVLLRYFENKSLREVGQAMGTSEDAAQKRVSRAVERLRELVGRNGVAIGASGLIAILSANAVQAAPVSLAATVISTATLAGAAMPATTAVATAQTIAMTTLQKTIVTVALVAGLGTGLYQTRVASELRHQNERLRAEQAALTGQLHQLQRDRNTAKNQAAALAAEIAGLRRNPAELLKLRDEVSRLRGESRELALLKGDPSADPTVSEAVTWQARVNALKQHLDQYPSERIPEFSLLTERDWLDVAKSKLESEKDYQRAMSELRRITETRFAAQLQPALKKYLEAHQQHFPTSLSQLQACFEKPVDEAILQRYAVLPREEVPSLVMGGEYIISPISPVNAELDTRVGIGPNGWGTVGASAWNDPVVATAKAFKQVMQAYSAAHGGGQPGDLADILPYAQSPEQKTAVERVIRNTKAAQEAKGE